MRVDYPLWNSDLMYGNKKELVTRTGSFLVTFIEFL